MTLPRPLQWYTLRAIYSGRTVPLTFKYLCPFAVYYLRYAVRSFFIISRISAKERDKKYSVKSP